MPPFTLSATALRFPHDPQHLPNSPSYDLIRIIVVSNCNEKPFSVRHGPPAVVDGRPQCPAAPRAARGVGGRCCGGRRGCLGGRGGDNVGGPIHVVVGRARLAACALVAVGCLVKIEVERCDKALGDGAVCTVRRGDTQRRQVSQRPRFGLSTPCICVNMHVCMIVCPAMEQAESAVLFPQNSMY